MRGGYISQSQFNAITTVGLMAAAMLLLLYTFTTSQQKPVDKKEPLSPTNLPSLSAAAVRQFELASPARKSGSFSSTANPTMDPRTARLFQLQTAQRRAMFETALNSADPSVPEVLLPIVPEVYCPSLVRIGAVGDGGKWVCNPWAMPKGGVVLSLGSHGDISFEADLQTATGRAASIITVDMTAASAPALSGLAEIQAKFVHAMIAPKTKLEENPPHYTVMDLMRRMGIKNIEILKMDIEGSEISVLPQFLDSNSVCQIMVEIHKIGEAPKLLRAIANAGFMLQKYELNAFWTGTGLCEYSFIHESCAKKYGATVLARYLNE